MGKLGRSKLCAICKRGMEIAEDTFGIFYLELDKNGGWKAELVKELQSEGIQINFQRISQDG